MQTFQAKEPLSAVRLYAMLNRTDGVPADSPMRLMQNFPHRIFTDEDMEKPLSELGMTDVSIREMLRAKCEATVVCSEPGMIVAILHNEKEMPPL